MPVTCQSQYDNLTPETTSQETGDRHTNVQRIQSGATGAGAQALRVQPRSQLFDRKALILNPFCTDEILV